MSTRIVICVDLVPDTVEQAYYDLYTIMGKTGLDWESSDEWYAANGDPIPESVAQATRMTVFRKINPEEKQA